MEYKGGHMVQDPDPVYRVYGTRWYILFIVFCLAVTQGILWITYSPIEDEAREYYHLCDPSPDATPGTSCQDSKAGESVIALLLAWGPIVYLITFPLTMVLARRGLRQVMVAASVLVFLTGIIRLIPLLVPMSDTVTIYLVHFAHILNAAVGPMIMATPTKVSGTWFTPSERTTATAVALAGSFVGPAVGFFAPCLVSTASQVPRLLVIHAVLATVVGISCLSYFPSEPPTPPCATASRQQSQSLWQSTVQVLSDTSALSVLVSGGLFAGVFSGWSASLDLIYTSMTDVENGWIGFSCTMGAAMGQILSGPIIDKGLSLKRKLRGTIVCLYVIVLVGLLCVTLTEPFFGSPALLPNTFASKLVITTLSGFFLGIVVPLQYEYAAELTYPIAEEISALWCTNINNFGCLVCLVLLPLLKSEQLNSVMMGTIVVCGGLMFCARDQYNRLDMEDGRQALLGDGGSEVSDIDIS